MAPQLEHISYKALLKYLRAATEALSQEGYDEAAHYFDMLTTTVEEWTPSKDFVFKTRDLGL